MRVVIDGFLAVVRPPEPMEDDPPDHRRRKVHEDIVGEPGFSREAFEPKKSSLRDPYAQKSAEEAVGSDPGPDRDLRPLA